MRVFRGIAVPASEAETTIESIIQQGFLEKIAWTTLHSNTSRLFYKPTSGRIAARVINHLGGEVMKVFSVM